MKNEILLRKLYAVKEAPHNTKVLDDLIAEVKLEMTDEFIRSFGLDGIDFVNSEEFAEALADATGDGAITEDAEPSSESVQSYMSAVRLQDAI